MPRRANRRTIMTEPRRVRRTRKSAPNRHGIEEKCGTQAAAFGGRIGVHRGRRLLVADDMTGRHGDHAEDAAAAPPRRGVDDGRIVVPVGVARAWKRSADGSRHTVRASSSPVGSFRASREGGAAWAERGRSLHAGCIAPTTAAGRLPGLARGQPERTTGAPVPAGMRSGRARARFGHRQLDVLRLRRKTSA